MFGSLLLEIDPDRALPDFDRIGGDADLGDVLADAVVELKLPLVPRAGDPAVGDETIMERGAAMGADVIHGAIAAFDVGDADRFVAAGEFFGFVGRGEIGLGGEFGESWHNE